jgi:hypothetical protein
MQHNIEVSEKNDGSSGQIALSFTKNQFADFIAGLLGKPQTITKHFEGSFCINKDTVINLFQIINQRIYQQNDGKIIQFRATVYYSDSTSTTLDGYEHFVHYNESHPVVSQGLNLNFVYLIKFAGKENYEKQEVDITFGHNENFQQLNGFPFQFVSGNLGISFRIQHTARSWGGDMESLLTKHLETLITKHDKLKFLIFRYSEEIGQLTISMMLISNVFVVLKLIERNAIEISLQNAVKIFASFVFSYSVGLIGKIFIENRAYFSNQSYVLLTPESIKNKEKNEKETTSKWWWYVGSIIFSIAIGILSNILFANFFDIKL